jgi:putative membrane-bound dehydrogenase-like protein
LSAGCTDGASPLAADDTTPAKAAPKAAPVKKKPPRYMVREDHDPNGIGKFYMGREIAHVMGFQGGGAAWLERPEREKEEASSKMIDELKLQPGQVVADIGAGTGILSLMMAEKVGNDGKVLAVDVQQEMLDIIAVKLKQRNVKNVELVKGQPKSPKLKSESLDLALFVDVYHEFAFPYEMMLEISKAMKVGGRIVLIEFRMEDETVPIKLVHKMTEAQAKKELGQPEFHLKWKETIGTLPWQHILVFERVADEDKPEAAGPQGDSKAAVDQPFPEIVNTEPSQEKLLTPEEALAKITVPEGFHVSLFAGEPDVQQPISLTTDERGRLWIAENYTYADSKINFDDKQRDRIVILEDTDGDGQFDERTVFWDQAQKLTSVEVGFGGVWALCAPHLLFIPDADRDDVPDSKPIIVLDGFDAMAVRHNIVNGLKWGPDGWLYGRHGILATSLVGKPGAAPSQRVPINTGIWRYHPTRGVFEAVAHGTTNSWGFDYDEHGEMFFINTVIGHLWHVVPGAHYRRMYGTDFNPYLYGLIEQTADHFHWDTGEAWSDIRKIGVSPTTDKAGGGHAHSGMMIYLGGNWPDQYRNTMFTVNLHGHRLNNDRLERHGAGYVGKHAPDFFKSDDPWFRGIDLIYGADGGVYIADWTDVGECHENDGVHRTSGRIFKVTYGKPKPVVGFDMAIATDADLVRAQVRPNDWTVRQARRILQERAAGGRDLAHARSLLFEVYGGEYMIPQKLRALWSLSAIGALDDAWLAEQLAHADEHVRSWAVRLLMDRPDVSHSAVAALQKLAAREKSGLVQVYLASAMQKIDQAERWPIAEAIASHDEFADDPELPLMVWYGIEPAVVHQPQRAVNLAVTSKMPVLRQNTARRLTVEIEKLPEAVNALVTRLGEIADPAVQLDLVTGMSQALRGWRKAPAPAAWKNTSDKLAASKNATIQNMTRELAVVFGDGRALGELRQIVGDGNAESESRRQSLRTLIDSRPDDLPALLQKLIGDRILVNEVVRGLATFDDANTPRLILDTYGRLDSEGRAIAVNTLVSRPSYARALLDAVAAGRISRSDLSAFHARQIRSFDDAALTARLTEVWGETRVADADKRKLIDRYKELLTPDQVAAANLPAGRALFNKTCANCHVLYGQGKAAGPDLTGSNRRNLEYLLENIIDPNASVAVDFRMSIASLASGRIVTGLVVEKTDKTLTFLTQNERIVVERSEIEDLKPTTSSLMPEGLFQNLSEEQLRDLAAYLMSTEQSPLP